MYIECITTSAAAQVMLILADAEMRVQMDFQVDGPNLPDPPVRFNLHKDLSCDVMRQLRSIQDATVVK